MTIQEINKAYDRIVGSLDCKELKDAFDFLQGLIAGSRAYAFQERLDELQDTYKYMLRYRMEGMNDPMQAQIYRNLLASTYELADQVRLQALAVDSPLTFFSRRRMLRKEAASISRLTRTLRGLVGALEGLPEGNTVGEKQVEETTGKLFDRIWLSDPLTAEEVAALRESLRDGETPVVAKSQIVSALMLGLQAYFDKEKLLLLFDAALDPDDEIRYRALVCILISLYCYRKRTDLYPQISDRLAALSEEFPGLTTAIRTITLRFILARETEKITRKLQDEILPEMIKLGPKLSQKINLQDINPETLGNEMNPEWQGLLSDSSLEEKIRKVNEMRQEGADIMHSTFTHLKSFPFFREIGNWFLPFTPRHSAFSGKLSEISNAMKLFNTIAKTGNMCNSDQYSLYLCLTQMPKQTQELMTGQFTSQMPEISEEMREEIINKQKRMEVVCAQYVQDLYRFFKLYPGHLDFEDIFALPLDFHNLPILRPYIDDQESLTTIAECYLRKNYFTDALTLYKRLANGTNESATLYQKIGYCKQMMGELQEALNAYLHADLIDPDSKWTIRRIAGCYRALKQPEKALEYYHRYEALSPDNLSVQISIGHCHLELKNYNEALKYYFKVDYLDNKSTKAWRPIAWCSFLTGKYDQARNYYRKIMENKPTMQDYLNAGHTEWAMQNIKGALSLYKKAAQTESDGLILFLELFNQDIPDLLSAGIEEEEIPLMLDQLRYSLME